VRVFVKLSRSWKHNCFLPFLVMTVAKLRIYSPILVIVPNLMLILHVYSTRLFLKLLINWVSAPWAQVFLMLFYYIRGNIFLCRRMYILLILIWEIDSFLNSRYNVIWCYSPIACILVYDTASDVHLAYRYSFLFPQLALNLNRSSYSWLVLSCRRALQIFPTI
jgi:hypothetical protein